MLSFRLSLWLSLLMLVLGATSAQAVPTLRRPQPPQRPITAADFGELLAAVNAEPFGNAKLECLRAVNGSRSYSFDGQQALALLGSFEFWVERVEALRLLPIIDRDRASVDAVRLFFEGAPALLRAEAQRVLAAGR